MLHGEPHLVHFEQDNEQDSDQVVKMKNTWKFCTQQEWAMSGKKDRCIKTERRIEKKAYWVYNKYVTRIEGII